MHGSTLVRFQLCSRWLPRYALAMPASDAEHFFERTRAAKKVMVLDLGFLGDTVHLLPALWMVRQAYPQAELHVAVAVAHHLADGLRAVGEPRLGLHALSAPCDVARKFSDGRAPAPRKIRRGHQPQRLRPFELADFFQRRARTPGPDAATTAVRRSGGACSPRMFRIRSAGEPVYLQRCRCLEKAGFPFTQPEFHARD